MEHECKGKGGLQYFYLSSDTAKLRAVINHPRCKRTCELALNVPDKTFLNFRDLKYPHPSKINRHFRDVDQKVLKSLKVCKEYGRVTNIIESLCSYGFGGSLRSLKVQLKVVNSDLGPVQMIKKGHKYVTSCKNISLGS